MFIMFNDSVCCVALDGSVFNVLLVVIFCVRTKKLLKSSNLCKILCFSLVHNFEISLITKVVSITVLTPSE